MKPIEELLQSEAVRLIEREMISIDRRTSYDKSSVSAMQHLLSVRKELLDSAFEQDEETLGLLRDFNECLTSELRYAHRKTVETFQKACELYNDCAIEIEGKVYMSYQLPTLFPVRKARNEEIWQILLDEGYQPLYSDGVTSPICLSNDNLDDVCSVEYTLFNDDVRFGGTLVTNWNEHLDRERTKDMHLVYAFHNLWEHVGGFSIFDLIYVRDFETTIDIHIVPRR